MPAALAVIPPATHFSTPAKELSATDLSARRPPSVDDLIIVVNNHRQCLANSLTRAFDYAIRLTDRRGIINTVRERT